MKWERIDKTAPRRCIDCQVLTPFEHMTPAEYERASKEPWRCDYCQLVIAQETGQAQTMKIQDQDIQYIDLVHRPELWPVIEAELERLRAVVDRVAKATLSQTGWEDDEDIVLLNGKPVGATITHHHKEFDRWWPSVRAELLGEAAEAATETKK